MTIITTLETIQEIEDMLAYNIPLVAEGEVVKVKNNYFTKTYKKLNGRMVNIILPIQEK